MSLKCTGMQNIINGFIRHRLNKRGDVLKEFIKSKDHPQPDSLVISCIDSRILSSRILQASPGEVLLSRNPGNIIPDYSLLHPKTPRDVEASIELACQHNFINSLIVCGHSDCKAMNLVYENRNNTDKLTIEKDGVLKTWLMSNSTKTIPMFLKLEKEEFKKPMQFKIAENQVFEAFIDPENRFSYNDKFSQLNTLAQLESLKNFSFLNRHLVSKRVNAFAMWFDIYNGDIYVFSYNDKCFVKLDERSHKNLSNSLEY